MHASSQPIKCILTANQMQPPSQSNAAFQPIKCIQTCRTRVIANDVGVVQSGQGHRLPHYLCSDRMDSLTYTHTRTSTLSISSPWMPQSQIGTVESSSQHTPGCQACYVPAWTRKETYSFISFIKRACAQHTTICKPCRQTYKKMCENVIRMISSMFSTQILLAQVD